MAWNNNTRKDLCLRWHAGHFGSPKALSWLPAGSLSDPRPKFPSSQTLLRAALCWPVFSFDLRSHNIKISNYLRLQNCERHKFRVAMISIMFIVYDGPVDSLIGRSARGTLGVSQNERVQRRMKRGTWIGASQLFMLNFRSSTLLGNFFRYVRSRAELVTTSVVCY